MAVTGLWDGTGLLKGLGAADRSVALHVPAIVSMFADACEDVAVLPLEACAIPLDGMVDKPTEQALLV